MSTQKGPQVKKHKDLEEASSTTFSSSGSGGVTPRRRGSHSHTHTHTDTPTHHHSPAKGFKGFTNTLFSRLSRHRSPRPSSTASQYHHGHPNLDHTEQYSSSSSGTVSRRGRGEDTASYTASSYLYSYSYYSYSSSYSSWSTADIEAITKDPPPTTEKNGKKNPPQNGKEKEEKNKPFTPAVLRSQLSFDSLNSEGVLDGKDNPHQGSSGDRNVHHSEGSRPLTTIFRPTAVTSSSNDNSLAGSGFGGTDDDAADVEGLRANIKSLLMARSTRESSPGALPSGGSTVMPFNHTITNAGGLVRQNTSGSDVNSTSALHQVTRSLHLQNSISSLQLRAKDVPLPMEVLQNNEELLEGANIPLFQPPPPVRTPVVHQIKTEVVEQPPSEEVLQQRRERGEMPYPSRLTYRMIAKPATTSDELLEERQRLQEDQRVAVAMKRHEKVDAGCCGSKKRFLKRRKKAEDRDAARRHINQSVLQRHYVPVVPFQTGRVEDASSDGTAEDEGGPSTPSLYSHRRMDRPLTIEEARAALLCGGDHSTGPGQLSRAMRDRARPRSVRMVRSAHALGEDGLPNCPRSSFLREGDPVTFWAAQLNERPLMQLEPIDEAEVFSVDSELSRLSEEDRLLNAKERLSKLEELQEKDRQRQEAPYSHFRTISEDTVISSMDQLDPEEERRRQTELSLRKLRSISPPHVQHPTPQAHNPYENMF